MHPRERVLERARLCVMGAGFSVDLLAEAEAHGLDCLPLVNRNPNTQTTIRWITTRRKMASRVAFQTSVGTAQYPWLNKPDTKFDEEGVYKTGLIMSKEDAASMMEEVQELAKEFLGKKISSSVPMGSRRRHRRDHLESKDQAAA